MGGVCLYPWGGSVCLLSGGKDAIRGLRMSFLFLGCFADEAFRPLALWSVASRALTPHPLPSTLTPNTRRPPAQSVEAPSPPPPPPAPPAFHAAELRKALRLFVWRCGEYGTVVGAPFFRSWNGFALSTLAGRALNVRIRRSSAHTRINALKIKCRRGLYILSVGGTYM